jgi:hypothetical protein
MIAHDQHSLCEGQVEQSLRLNGIAYYLGQLELFTFNLFGIIITGLQP